MKINPAFTLLMTLTFGFNSFGEDTKSPDPSCKTCAEKEASFLNTIPTKIEKEFKVLNCKLHPKDQFGCTKSECLGVIDSSGDSPSCKHTSTTGIRG